MKVKELISLLQAMPQDLEVYGYCDHGQSPEKVSTPSIGYATKLEYTIWDEWGSIREEAAEEGYDKKFVLL